MKQFALVLLAVALVAAFVPAAQAQGNRWDGDWTVGFCSVRSPLPGSCYFLSYWFC